MTTNADVLATVEAARKRARRAKRAGWIPLLVFGILVLPAAVFHLRAQTESARLTAAAHGGVLRVPSGAFPVDGGPGLFWYWQIAIPLGYALVAVLYGVRNRRAGVRSPVRTYVVTGVVLVVALYYFDNVAVMPLGWGDFTIHGMEATITIGLALFVLAWVERSVALTASAVVVTAVALVATLYNVEDVWYQVFSWSEPSDLSYTSNELALSATLLLCAAVVALVDHRRTRTGRPA